VAKAENVVMAKISWHQWQWRKRNGGGQQRRRNISHQDVKMKAINGCRKWRMKCENGENG
jgi:hypothetical protein